jgi:diphosphomevalonate decarboxylase
LNDFAFLRGGHLSIETRNSFPHSAGIASSASGMCALVAGLTDLREQVSGIKLSPEAFRREVSFFSRLASGSACRSVYPRLASWGVVENLENSSEEYASERACHVIFHDYRDSILIVSADEKAVSSRAGHALMENNPFADTRYALARKNFDELYSAMQTADLETFVRVTENEALMLHALMMLSEPSFILMKPATLAVIEAVLNFRASEKIPVCFTLDAGPNVHLLYPAQNEEKVKAWIERDLLQYCAGGRVIHDQVGLGAKKMPV